MLLFLLQNTNCAIIWTPQHRMASTTTYGPRLLFPFYGKFGILGMFKSSGTTLTLLPLPLGTLLPISPFGLIDLRILVKSSQPCYDGNTSPSFLAQTCNFVIHDHLWVMHSGGILSPWWLFRKNTFWRFFQHYLLWHYTNFVIFFSSVYFSLELWRSSKQHDRIDVHTGTQSTPADQIMHRC